MKAGEKLLHESYNGEVLRRCREKQRSATATRGITLRRKIREGKKRKEIGIKKKKKATEEIKEGYNSDIYGTGVPGVGGGRLTPLTIGLDLRQSVRPPL